MVASGAVMARRKSQPKKQRTAGPPRRVALQASDAWVEWAEAGADFCGTDFSKLVDAALAFYLRAQGFEKPRPKRVP
jgi:hypothetical protein